MRQFESDDFRRKGFHQKLPKRYCEWLRFKSVFTSNFHHGLSWTTPRCFLIEKTFESEGGEEQIKWIKSSINHFYNASLPCHVSGSVWGGGLARRRRVSRRKFLLHRAYLCYRRWNFTFAREKYVTRRWWRDEAMFVFHLVAQHSCFCSKSKRPSTEEFLWVVGFYLPRYRIHKHLRYFKEWFTTSRDEIYLCRKLFYGSENFR